MATATKNAKKTTKTTKGKKGAAEKKDRGLGKPAIRILTALSKAKAPLTRAEICEAAPQDPAWIKLWLGFKDGRPGKHDLLEPGLVKVEEQDINGRNVLAYKITALGRTELQKALKAQK